MSTRPDYHTELTVILLYLAGTAPEILDQILLLLAALGYIYTITFEELKTLVIFWLSELVGVN